MNNSVKEAINAKIQEYNELMRRNFKLDSFITAKSNLLIPKGKKNDFSNLVHCALYTSLFDSKTGAFMGEVKITSFSIDEYEKLLFTSEEKLKVDKNYNFMAGAFCEVLYDPRATETSPTETLKTKKGE